VLAGHGSWLDFLIVALALFPHRINFMAAYNFFRDPLLKLLMGWMGVIPKNQFTSDNKHHTSME
jgi:1-acyl-sn-glycerol-3-phosphate acyltransferase